MAYNAEQLRNLARHKRDVSKELRELKERLVLVGETLPTESRVYEKVVPRAARRVSVREIGSAHNRKPIT